ncbi:astacin-like metalloendopeptidase [Aquarana catesbeiana]|uniref:astacin-like metalloendopeptidase n=1 Tax=Aquarana catesbeiana TaxID=8400 RepID=UPI003CCA16FE
MAPTTLFLVISASFLSLGLTVPIPTVQPDNSIDADKTAFDDDDWTISDQIAQANEANSSRDLIISATLEFATMTCVHFQKRTTEPNYLSFEDKGGGCWSFTGKVNGGQTVSIDKDFCMSYGVIQHEIMHSLGFHHEHNRLDRDKYVAINWQYISPPTALIQIYGQSGIDRQVITDACGKSQDERFFITIAAIQGMCTYLNLMSSLLLSVSVWLQQLAQGDSSRENRGLFVPDRGNTTNIPYDYTSVMHYGRYTYSNKSGVMSIVPIPNPKVPIGQTIGLSSLDVKRINVLYNCNLCRTKLLGASGDFSSSDATPIDMRDNCLWLLHAPSKLILLQFGTFVCSSTNCSANINVYDGVSKNSSLLATIRADQPLPVLISSGRFMLLEYITDPSTLSSFNGSYSSVTYGGTFTTNGGTVVSPNYPSSYPNNVNCTYIIIAPPQNQVMLTFSDFGLESSPQCSNDYLEIRDGGNHNASLLGVYCGQMRNMTVQSSGPMVLLQFSSNNKINGIGFSANYFFVSSR